MSVLREGAVAHLAAVLHVVGNVAHCHGHAAGHGLDDDVPDVGDVSHHALAADEVALVVFLNIGSARVDVVLLQRLQQLGDAHAQGVEAAGREGYLVLLDAAAHGVDLHHAGYHGQLSAHRPVLYGAQFLRRVQGSVGHEAVQVNLAEARGDGSHLGTAHALGYLLAHGAQFLLHQLSGQVGAHVVSEDDCHQRQAKA